MDYATLRFELSAGVARITLDRPGAANALNAQMAHELAHAAIRASEDASVRAVILTGAGRADSREGIDAFIAKRPPRFG